MILNSYLILQTNKMKTKKLNLKSIALSMAMAVMLLPLTANAQHDENKFGLREWGTINAQYDGNKFGLQEWGQTSLLGREGGGNRIDGNEVFNLNVGIQPFQDPAPLGSGIAILIGAGLGYVALKKKEDEQ